MKSHRFRMAILAIAVLFAGSVVAYRYWPQTQSDSPSTFRFEEPAPDNPQLTFATTFRNVRPGVKYVGDQSCKACHEEIHKSFHQHPMGRSATLSSDPMLGDRYDIATRPSFTSPDGREYRVEQINDQTIHSEIFISRDNQKLATQLEAEIVIGSGQLGKSYLCIRDGSVWETGLSWFSTKQIWDISPGFTPGQHGTRAIFPGCLYCHVNQIDHVVGTLNRYDMPLLGKQASIGCERCHGPGELHVNEQLSAKSTVIPDTSIVNPKHLDPGLRDSICQQCHLQGERRVVRRGRDIFEFRPGLPLELFQAIFVKPDSQSQKSVGQVEQLRTSRCSIASQGKMGCTSCHNPHAQPTAAEKVSHFRQACLTCHMDRSCSTPIADRQTKNDSCVACHMSTGGSANIPHASVTDHRILRNPGSRPANSQTPTNSLPFVLFHELSKYRPDSDERDRDLGMALAKQIVEIPQSDSSLIKEAIPRLESAVKRHPSDAQAWEMLSRVKGLRGQWKEAFADIVKAVTIASRDESILQWASECAFEMEQHPQSLDFARRAVAVNPGNVENHTIVGNALMEMGEYKQASDAFQHVIRINPARANARAGFAICLNRLGDSRGGQKMLELAIELEPERAKQFREWYLRKVK